VIAGVVDRPLLDAMPEIIPVEPDSDNADVGNTVAQGKINSFRFSQLKEFTYA